MKYEDLIHKDPSEVNMEEIAAKYNTKMELDLESLKNISGGDQEDHDPLSVIESGRLRCPHCGGKYIVDFCMAGMLYCHCENCGETLVAG